MIKKNFKFGRKSKERLNTIHPLLQDVLNEALEYVDFTILEGSRSVERQQQLVDEGKSTTMNSKHIVREGKAWSRAVDIAPYPIRWGGIDNEKDVRDLGRIYMFIGFIKGIAVKRGVDIRIGADWDGDFNTQDQSFHDLFHIELVGYE